MFCIKLIIETELLKLTSATKADIKLSMGIASNVKSKIFLLLGMDLSRRQFFYRCKNIAECCYEI